MRGRHLVCIALILASSLLLFCSAILMPTAMAASAGISIIPSYVLTNVSHDFIINITVANVMDLYGWETKLSWNPILLDVVNVVEGPLLATRGETFFTYVVNWTTGYMVVDGTLLGLVPGASGNGTLATVTFHAKNTGECSLDVYDLKLIDSHDFPIISQIQDGYVRSGNLHDVAVKAISVLPITALPGTIVTINITVENEGVFPEDFNVTTSANNTIVGTQQVSLANASSAILSFIWDTSGYQKGEYPISASASTVAGETDTTDNTLIADFPVTLLYAGHDLAVTQVEPLKTVVGQNYTMYTNVTVKNYGTFEETFDTTLYVNSTAIQSTIVTLASGEHATIRFLWNTASWPKGNCTVSAIASPVSGETYTLDNEANGGIVTIATPADVNADGKVDMRDIGICCIAFGSTPDRGHWNSNADINNDQAVNMRDIGLACAFFGDH